MINKLELKEIPESKAERMELVLNKMIESLPIPARILATNSITSFLQYSEEGVEKILNVLRELESFIDRGEYPNDNDEQLPEDFKE
jgi:hypothetical protein